MYFKNSVGAMAPGSNTYDIVTYKVYQTITASYLNLLTYTELCY